MPGIFNKHCEIELGLSHVLSDRLGGAAVQVEEQPSWEREAVLEEQETTPKRVRQQCQQHRVDRRECKCFLGLSETHGKRGLGKGTPPAARPAMISTIIVWELKA